MATPRFFALCAAIVLTFPEPSAAASISGRERLEPDTEGPGLATDATAAEFEEYSKRFSRKYEHGSKEYWLRRGLFEQRSAAVKAQNAKLDRLWEAVAGPFADFTEAERASMRGYRSRLSSPASGGAELPAAALKARELLRPTLGNATLPKKFDWLNLTVAKMIPDQGQCGSCWAVTAKSVLDAHYEIYVAKGGPIRNFSAQQIVSCVPNPEACGGTGGCKGATVELAFDWVVHNGCADENHVKYKAADLSEKLAKCNESKILSMPSHGGLYGTGSQHLSSHHTPAMPEKAGLSFGMHGYHMLPRNKEQPLVMALYQHGPVATSTAAGAWYEYSRGIFDGCKKDTIVDHAVTLYGYGEAHVKPQPLMPVFTKGDLDAQPLFESNIKKYWLIRNSWGKNWGEKGFIRMLRRGDQDDKYCGTDVDNAQGTGCPKEPGFKKNVTVCGMCGFLWDSVVPHFHEPSAASFEQDHVEMDSAGKLVRREPEP